MFGPIQEHTTLKPLKPAPLDFKEEIKQKPSFDVSMSNADLNRYTENMINRPIQDNVPEVENPFSWKISSENVPIRKPKDFVNFGVSN